MADIRPQIRIAGKRVETRDLYRKLCGYQQNLLSNTEFSLCSNCYLLSSEWIESILSEKSIPILNLSWWYNIEQCSEKKACQKWCSNCFTIYVECRYCLTTNIIFGFTNQSQCIKCKRVEPISINGNYNIDEFLNSTIDINDEVANYMNNVDKDNNDPLKIYDFIKNKLEISKNIKMIVYSKIEDFKRIAEGGFGIIYKAAWKINSSNKKIVAVKKFKSQNISKYFIDELKSFNQYHNRFEHIIKYYGISQDPNTKDHMIIMQYADGGNLYEYLQYNFINITWEDKLTIILEISRGVDCIHKEKFIHRDLHSGNILLANDKWHIGDLGLSRPANITSNNEMYGVIPYIAPEIFNGKAFSKESDIYSLGMTMWELTTGCKPFAESDHDINLIYKILDGKRPEITYDTPKFFADLLKKCWDSDPSKRPHIKEIRKTICLWIFMIKDVLHSHINQAEKVEVNDKFNQVEKIRLELIRANKLGPGFAAKSHPGAIYTSRLLNPLISESLSISLSSSASFNMYQKYKSKELGFDINNTKWSSLSEINSTIQNLVNNTQCPNAIYTSRPLNKLFPTKQEYSSKEIELDINDDRWSPLPDVNSTFQNLLSTQRPVNSRKRKIAEIKTEIRNNKKLVKTNDNINLES
ncbi:kinase-like protein [Rhizophagus irregularis]|uniref:Kinase-like protein n=1 Tax=Rhizophagus irregularis TaxID=588596 RepID=A0A2I1HH47_9GLOM|nr:kinase-like protein [Rhizophagus irregularis]